MANIISYKAIVISLLLGDAMKTNVRNGNVGAATGAPLVTLRLEGAVVFILSIVLYGHLRAGWGRFLLLLLVPDLSMAGYWLGARWGAVCYNLAHSYVGPILLAAFAIMAAQLGWIPYLLIWGAHIGMDRALGYGLKYPLGFKQTHLGLIGKSVVA
jgi:hypothetical protein